MSERPEVWQKKLKVTPETENPYDICENSWTRNEKSLRLVRLTQLKDEPIKIS